MRRRHSCAGCLVRLILVLIVLLAGGAATAYVLLNRPYQGFDKPVILDFPKGTSTASMGRQLAEGGVIRFSWEFLLARVLRPYVRLQAGEYQFAHADSALTVFDRIARGDVFYYEITVPEGSNIFDISAAVDRLVPARVPVGLAGLTGVTVAGDRRVPAGLAGLTGLTPAVDRRVPAA